MKTSPNNNSENFDANVSSPSSAPRLVRPNWHWLQARLFHDDRAHSFAQWLSEELETLEADFSDLMTEKSKNHDSEGTPRS